MFLHLAWHLPGHKASRFVHDRSYSVPTLGRSKPGLAGLVPLMGKASVSNFTVPPGYCLVPKGLAMACLLFVASLLAILPSASSGFCPLTRLLLLQLAPYCHFILPDCWSTPPLCLVLVLHYLDSWWATPWIDVITDATIRLWLQMLDNRSRGFLSSQSSHILPLRPRPAFASQSLL